MAIPCLGLPHSHDPALPPSPHILLVIQHFLPHPHVDFYVSTSPFQLPRCPPASHIFCQIQVVLKAPPSDHALTSFSGCPQFFSSTAHAAQQIYILPNQPTSSSTTLQRFRRSYILPDDPTPFPTTSHPPQSRACFPRTLDSAQRSTASINNPASCHMISHPCNCSTLSSLVSCRSPYSYVLFY